MLFSSSRTRASGSATHERGAARPERGGARRARADRELPGRAVRAVARAAHPLDGDLRLRAAGRRRSATSAQGDRLALLDWLEADLGRAYTGTAAASALAAADADPAGLALPRAPFAALIEANRRDQPSRATRPGAQLAEYCEYSANPVGRLVLHVFGAATPERFALSDAGVHGAPARRALPGRGRGLSRAAACTCPPRTWCASARGRRTSPRRRRRPRCAAAALRGRARARRCSIVGQRARAHALRTRAARGRGLHRRRARGARRDRTRGLRRARRRSRSRAGAISLRRLVRRCVSESCARRGSRSSAAGSRAWPPALACARRGLRGLAASRRDRGSAARPGRRELRGSRSTTASTCSCAAARRTSSSSSGSARGIASVLQPRLAIPVLAPGGRTSWLRRTGCRRRCTWRQPARFAPLSLGERLRLGDGAAARSPSTLDDPRNDAVTLRRVAARARAIRARDRALLGPGRAPDVEPARGRSVARARRQGLPDGAAPGARRPRTSATPRCRSQHVHADPAERALEKVGASVWKRARVQRDRARGERRSRRALDQRRAHRVRRDRARRAARGRREAPSRAGRARPRGAGGARHARRS